MKRPKAAQPFLIRARIGRIIGRELQRIRALEECAVNKDQARGAIIALEWVSGFVKEMPRPVRRWPQIETKAKETDEEENRQNKTSAAAA